MLDFSSTHPHSIHILHMRMWMPLCGCGCQISTDSLRMPMRISGPSLQCPITFLPCATLPFVNVQSSFKNRSRLFRPVFFLFCPVYIACPCVFRPVYVPSVPPDIDVQRTLPNLCFYEQSFGAGDDTQSHLYSGLVWSSCF